MIFGRYLPKRPETPEIDRNDPKFFQSGIGTPWTKLLESPLFDTTHEKTIWDYGGDEPKFANIFNDAMASDARLVMSIVVDKCKGVFKGLKSFVDVGGGTGTVSKATADTFPDIECTVFDLPLVVADFQGSKNLKYVGGDMFEAVPLADAVFMKVKYILVLFSPGTFFLLRNREILPSGAISTRYMNGRTYC